MLKDNFLFPENLNLKNLSGYFHIFIVLNSEYRIENANVLSWR